MKKILFPTEFSDHAPEVFKYAAELAYFFKANLVVMHAFGQPDELMAKHETMEHVADVSVDRMIELVTKNIPHKYREHIHVDYVTKIGFATDAILQVALDENIDLIVMSMTGKTNALETIFGGTALKVLAKADCPVLMVPASVQFKGIDNLVFTTNFEFRDLAAINYLKKWSKAFAAPIHCLHVVEEGENEVEAVKNMGVLRQTFKRHKRMHFEITQGVFQEETENFANGIQADIVAMMSHKRSFISKLLEKSAVEGIALRTHIPLLLIKDNAFEWDHETAAWVRLVNSFA